VSFVEFTGRARLGKRTKQLVGRLGPDDIAIIDHQDIDRVSAEELLDSGVRVVVNVARSQSGRFPNPGPLLLVRGGVRLIDAPGAALFDELADGENVTIRGSSVFRNGTCVVNGRSLEAGELSHALDETRFREHHALVVARGPGYKRDLAIVRPYVRDFKPVLVGVDGGADALLASGMKPHVIVGDMDSVSDRALVSGAELVVHAYRDGNAPGAARLDRLGVTYTTVSAPGISEDVALLLAYEKGAELIVAVGTHFNLIEFLERDRAGMSSTFVTRLKVGEILIDAKGVSRLVSRQVGLWPLILLAVAGLGAVVVAIVASPGLRHFIGLLSQRIRDLLGLG
jgi:uncharacterized membrane-anchored protein